MPRSLVVTGNEAAAWAARMADVKGVGFFPYGPADEVGETLSLWKSRGEHECTIFQLGNEPTAYNTLQGLASTGARCLMVTTSEGMLWIAPTFHTSVSKGNPIVTALPSRSLAGTVSSDVRDFLSVKTLYPMGWYCESPQDVFDTVLQAFKIGEHPLVQLPAVVGYDGYGGVSHANEDVVIPTAEELGDFLPPWTTRVNHWDMAGGDSEWRTRMRRGARDGGMEVQYQQVKRFFLNVPRIVEEVGREYQKITGSRHVGLLDPYHMEDAEVALVTMGCINPTAKAVVDVFRDQEGIKVGIIKPRLFMPFSDKAIREALSKVKAFSVVARDPYFEVYRDVRAAMALPGAGQLPLMMARSVGLSGRDISPEDIGNCVLDLLQVVEEGRVEREFDYIPVRNRPAGDVMAIER